MIDEKDIFERLKSGEAIPMYDEEYPKIRKAVNETRLLLNELNNSTGPEEIRRLLGTITQTPIVLFLLKL